LKSPVNRGGLRFWLVAAALLSMQASAKSVLLGLPLVAAGIFVHLWAKGCLRQNLEVTMTGPYRFVRHPFYTANALIDLAIAVMSGWWPLVALLPVWWLAVYIPVIRSEENFLTREFGSVYSEYRKRVPMLLPLRRPLPAEGEGFSWRNRNIQAGTEVPRVLRLAAYPVLFGVWKEVLAEGTGFFSQPDHAGLWLLSTLAGLHVLAWQAKVHLKHRQRMVPEVLSGGGARTVFAAGLLLAGAAVTSAETEAHWLILGMGASLMMLSVIVSVRREGWRLVSECLALMGTMALCELMWMMAIPAVYYGALILDGRLTGAFGGEARQEREVMKPGLSWLAAYGSMVLCGIATSVVKEVVIG